MESTSLAPCEACHPSEFSLVGGSQAGPCCDETCLENVARRECVLECNESGLVACRGEQNTSSQPTNAVSVTHGFDERISPVVSQSSILCTTSRKRKRQACSSHLNSVRGRYLSTLMRVGCICRDLITQKMEPCCSVSRPTSVRGLAVSDGKIKSPSVSASSFDASIGNCVRAERFGDTRNETTLAVVGCCSPQRKDGCSTTKRNDCCGIREGALESGGSTADSNCPGRKARTPCHSLTLDTDQPNGHEAEQQNTGLGKSDATACGSRRVKLDDCGERTCCNTSDAWAEKVTSTQQPVPGQISDQTDIERGTTYLEHIVLSVQGLTCIGCETKLVRSLQSIPGIRNLRTSLVLAQAEFDLDTRAGEVVDVTRHVERTTGFACQRLLDEGQTIDVIINGDVKAFVDSEYPDGVIRMIPAGRQTVRITYDARVIGTRKLMGQFPRDHLRLAPRSRSSELESGKKHVREMAWKTLLSVILTIPVLIMAWAPLPPRPLVYGSVSLALATMVQFALAGSFYPSALRAVVFTHVIELDLLIVLSTSTAYIFSLVSFAYEVAGNPLPTGEFFETSTLLVTLIILGRWVSAFARYKAVKSVSIKSLQAEKAVLCDADGNHDEEIDASLLQYGDFFKVSPESRIPTDGVVVWGTTEADESLVTGEFLPVDKLPGSLVIAGSVNGSGVIVVRLTHLPSNNTISTIANMVDEAKFSKPKIQELVDLVASYFVPVILGLTIITFTVWVVVGMSVRHENGSRAVVNAITYAISVLIVSCPCAIGLAVPMVVVIAGGVAAKHGVIFKSSTVIETARKVSHVVFDKTGTLTQGVLSVTEEIHLSENHNEAASIALGLTCDSKHPVSVAISTHLKEKGVKAAKISEIKSVVGSGVMGNFESVSVRCGNSRWLSAEDNATVHNLLAKGLTVFCVGTETQLFAMFGLCDSLRPDSHAVIQRLQRRNIAVSIVSGDDSGAVEAVAGKLGIQSSQVRSRCTPGDKQQYLKTLMATDNQVVIFCGDGTNDAVALAQADIGVHMNSGSDMAQTAADVVLMRPHLSGVLVLIDLSKASFRRIFFNFAWSFVYNLFAILLAAGAFVNARIPPEYAGLGEIVSVLPVILIALQLKWFKTEQ